MANFTVQESTLKIIRPFETLVLKAYWDVSRWSIGYGSGTLRNGATVKQTDVVTAAEAEYLLKRDAGEAAGYVNRYVTSNINRNQWDALVDLVYNIGIGTYTKSNLYQLVNANPNNLPLIKIAFEAPNFTSYNRLRRRQAEYAIYSSGIVATEEGASGNSMLIIVVILAALFYFSNKKKRK